MIDVFLFLLEEKMSFYCFLNGKVLNFFQLVGVGVKSRAFLFQNHIMYFNAGSGDEIYSRGDENMVTDIRLLNKAVRSRIIASL